MKVILVTSSYWPRVNGVTVSVDTFVSEFRKKGHTVYVFAPEYTKDDPGKDDEFLVRFPSYTPVGISKEDRLVSPRAGWPVFKALKTIKPDVIHLQTEFSLEHMVKNIAIRMGIPCVQSFHTFFQEYINHYIPFLPRVVNKQLFRAITQATAHNNNAIVVPTTQMHKALNPVLHDRRMHIVPTGLELDRFTPPTERHIGNTFPAVSNGKKSLMYVGRLGKEKNVAFLLPVLKDLIGRGLEVQLFIIGDGPDRESLKKKARQMRLEDSVHFTGYLTREQVKEFFYAVDVFTFPSKTETQGLVTLESMACGTPVVAIGEMGTAEVMNGDNGGFMVPEDHAEFTARVYDLLTDDRLYQKKRDEALSYVRQWSSELMAEKLLMLYTKTIENHRGHGRRITRKAIGKIFRRGLYLLRRRRLQYTRQAKLRMRERGRK